MASCRRFKCNRYNSAMAFEKALKFALRDPIHFGHQHCGHHIARQNPTRAQPRWRIVTLEQAPGNRSKPYQYQCQLKLVHLQPLLSHFSTLEPKNERKSQRAQYKNQAAQLKNNVWSCAQTRLPMITARSQFCVFDSFLDLTVPLSGQRHVNNFLPRFALDVLILLHLGTEEMLP